MLRRLLDKFPQCNVIVFLPGSSSSLPHACITSVYSQFFSGERVETLFSFFFFFYTVLSQYPLLMPNHSLGVPDAFLYVCLTKVMSFSSKRKDISFPNI